MAKLAESATEQIARALGATHRTADSPLERAMRDAGIKTAGGAIEHAVREQERIVALGRREDMTPDRLRSPYRTELDHLSLDVRRRQAPLQNIAPSPPVEEIKSVAQIGARVRTARRAMKMTQQQFADLAGVGRRFVVELEQGKKSLEIERVFAVCQAAGVRIRFI